MNFVFRLSALLTAIVALVTNANSQTPPAPQPTVLTNVRLADDVDAPRVSILLRNGRVIEILDAGVELPGGYRLVDGGGGLALPAFMDACSTIGVSTPQPESTQDSMSSLEANVHVGMREANRKGLQPSLEVVSVLSLSESDFEAYRDQGYAVLHSSASGEILSGQSCVTTLSDAALRDRVVANNVYMGAAFSASGSGYPSTLMGYLSHLRQFFLDASWHATRVDRFGKGRLERRPPFDPELEALGAVLEKKQRLLCHANSARDIRRWLKFARVQDIEIAIRGGRESWKVATELAEAGVPVFLSLAWGDEVEDPDKEEEKQKEEAEEPGEDDEGEPEEDAGDEITEVPPEEQDSPQEPETAEGQEPAKEGEADPETPNSWKYEEPLGVQRERRREWEELRDCALRLHDAGVQFVFGTDGQTPADLLKNARKLVKLGLPEEAALAAMTTGVAAFTGLEGRLGKIEKGFDANIAIWSDSPFAKKASLERLFIDGSTFEFSRDEEAKEAPAEGVDLTGKWEVIYDDQGGSPAILDLEMNAEGEIEGTLSFETPGGSMSHSELTGNLSGHDLTLKGSIEMGQFSARIRIEGRVEGDGFSGDATWKFSGGEDSNSFTAKRKPESNEHGHPHGGHQ